MKTPIIRKGTIDKYYLKLCFLCFLINTNRDVSLSNFCKTHKLNRNFRLAIIQLGIIERVGVHGSKKQKYKVLVSGVSKQMAEDVLLFSDAMSKKVKIEIDKKTTLWDYLKNFFLRQDKNNVLSLKSYPPQTRI